MIKLLFGEVPEWARQSHPLLRYEMARNRENQQLPARFGRILVWALALIVLGLGGYAYATAGFQRGFQIPYTADLWKMLLLPAFFVGLLMRLAGLSLGLGAISNERRRQTWDNLRSTELGAELALRTRWVSILFYRLRGFLLISLLARLVLVGGLLYELTSMQGAYLDILANRSNPALSLELALVLLAAFMTAFMLLPITATGFDIALGLFVSTRLQNRAWIAIVQVLLIVFRAGSMLILMLLTLNFLDGSLELSELPALALLSSGAAFSDGGLSLSHLTRTGQYWSQIPYSIFIGAGLLLLVLLQVALTSLLLHLSVRAAERNE